MLGQAEAHKPGPCLICGRLYEEARNKCPFLNDTILMPVVRRARDVQKSSRQTSHRVSNAFRGEFVVNEPFIIPDFAGKMFNQRYLSRT